MRRCWYHLPAAVIGIISLIFWWGTVFLWATESPPSDTVILLDNDVSMDMTAFPNLEACPCLNPNHYYIDPENPSHNLRFSDSFPDDGSEIWRYHYNSDEILISVLNRDEKGDIRCEAANEAKGCFDRRILGQRAVITLMQNILSYNTENRIAYLPFDDASHTVAFTSDMEILSAALETTKSSTHGNETYAIAKAQVMLEKRTPKEKQERPGHIIIVTNSQNKEIKEHEILTYTSHQLFQHIALNINDTEKNKKNDTYTHIIDLSDDGEVLTVKKRGQTIYRTGSDQESLVHATERISTAILSTPKH